MIKPNLLCFFLIGSCQDKRNLHSAMDSESSNVKGFLTNKTKMVGSLTQKKRVLWCITFHKVCFSKLDVVIVQLDRIGCFFRDVLPPDILSFLNHLETALCTLNFKVWWQWQMVIMFQKHFITVSLDGARKQSQWKQLCSLRHWVSPAFDVAQNSLWPAHCSVSVQPVASCSCWHPLCFSDTVVAFGGVR